VASKSMTITIKGDSRDFVVAVDQAERKLGDFDGKAARSSSGGGGLGALAGTLGTIGKAALIAGGGMLALGGGALGIGVGIAADMEQAKIGFTTMLGSAEQADAFIKQMQEFAAKTPFEFAGLQDSASKLLAVGVGAERVIPLMTVLGDATSAVGTGEEGIQRAVMALGQMQQKGKVTGEEMMQLVEAGVPAWDALANKLGVDVATAQDRVSKGQVGVNDLFAAIETSAGPALGRVKGMMDQQSQSLKGLLSSLKDTVMMQLADVAAPLAESFKASLPQITQALGQIIPSLAPLATAITSSLGPVLAAMAPIIASVAEHFGSLLGDIVTALTPVMVALAPVIRQVAGTLGGLLLTAVQALAPVIVALAPHFAQLVNVVGDKLMPIIEALIPPIGQVLTAIAPLIPMIAELAGTYLVALAEAVAPVIAAMAPFITQLVTALEPVLKQIQPMLVELAQKMGTDLLDAVVTLLPPLTQLLLMLIPYIPTFVSILVEVLKMTAALPLLTATMKWLGDVVGQVWREISTAIKPVIDWFQSTGSPALQIAAQWIGDKFQALADTTSRVWRGIQDTVRGVVDFITGIPGRVGNALSGIWDGLTSGLRNAITGAKNLWNDFARTFRIDLPGDGLDIGLPTFHTGGTFHAARPGGEGLALLRDGERIVTPSTQITRAQLEPAQMTRTVQLIVDRRVWAEGTANLLTSREFTLR
jgi:tape measure domain-containing protein